MEQFNELIHKVAKQYDMSDVEVMMKAMNEADSARLEDIEKVLKILVD